MAADPIAAFYDRHPYPPPVDDLEAHGGEWPQTRRRVEHHRRWPTLPHRDDPRILVAGCGTSQAARYAERLPNAQVVGVDAAATSIEATRRLVERHGLSNLELRVLRLEDVADLGRRFDSIVCTGVLHHLADPEAGLRALREVLEPTGVIDLSVYATYGRTGVTLMQDYCRRLGVGASASEMADLVATLREIPTGHPLRPLLASTPDFRDDDSLADVLLNPRDRTYSVPQVLELVAEAGLRFGRWVRQAPYLPQCGSLTGVPHGARIGALAEADQYAAVELFRGTMTTHSVIAYRDDSPLMSPPLRWDDDSWPDFVPLRPPTVVSVEDRLPPGAAAALLNQAHTDPDLVMFVDGPEAQSFAAVDGVSTIAQIGGTLGGGVAARRFFERLWHHDLVIIDATADC